MLAFAFAFRGERSPRAPSISVQCTGARGNSHIKIQSASTGGEHKGRAQGHRGAQGRPVPRAPVPRLTATASTGGDDGAHRGRSPLAPIGGAHIPLFYSAFVYSLAPYSHDIAN